MRRALKESFGFLAEFHARLTSILVVQWFRSRRVEVKKAMLLREYPLKYSENDAKEAREWLQRITESEDLTSFVLQVGASALSSLQLTRSSVALFRECLQLKGLSPLERGIICENIAVVYRENRNYRLMLQHAKRALGHYREAGDQYRTCIALKNIGEAEWMLGFKEKALRLFSEAQFLGDRLPDIMQRCAVIWNLAYAFRRIGESKHEISYLKRCLETLPEEETEKILEVDRRLAALTRDR